jgi:hypothetical protein
VLVWSSTYSRSWGLRTTWTYPLLGYETPQDQHRPLRARPATIACAAHHSSAAANHTPEGTVVGRIDACSGLGYAKPRYVGGTVLALRGAVRSVQTSAATGKLLLPSDVVARQQVPVGGQFHFRLLPGRYVIDLRHYVGGNVGTWASVTVRGGETVHADLPNMCITG